jgi:hypothetical protein
MSIQSSINGVLCVVVALVGVTGCATICPILNVVADTAKEACPIVVEYLDDDGKKHQVAVPREVMLGAVKNAAVKAGLPSPKGSASVHVDAVPSSSVKTSTSSSAK